ncbi:MAG: hypothetical protein E7667_05480 [Ruminococcaceae bacterium]|nr:hypothetical protein [Oscillospiraceae bacterium]
MFKKIISLTLICVMLISAVCMTSCSKKVMKIEKSKAYVSAYEIEFFMTRMKGVLESYGYDVSSSSFWGSVISSDGMTADEYYKSEVLGEASRYLIAQYLFEQEGLELTKEEKQKVEDDIDLLIEYAGSKNELNAILGEYGVNVKILKNIYLNELKIQKLTAHLFGSDGSKISGSADRKQEYMEENYVCYKQVFIAAYDYATETDKQGNTIYYTDETAKHISYDTEGGAPRVDVYDSKKFETDANGDVIYYSTDGKSIAYKETEYKKYLVDKNGERIIELFDDEKKAETALFAQELSQGKKTVEEFEEMISKYSDNDNGDKWYLKHQAGYYESQGADFAYFDKIADALKGMSDGECKVIASSVGYHIVYKYEHDVGAYADKAYADVFAGFDSEFVNMLFEEKCKQYENKIKIDQKELDKLPSMKDVASNLLY